MGIMHISINRDFNCGHIDWETPAAKPNAHESDAHHELLNFMKDQALTNIQHENTRESSNLDLYLTTNPSLVKTQSFQV